MKPVVLITGASSGIGSALAKVFAAHGHELALVARRQDRLEALADEIAATGRPRPTVFTADLERREAASIIAAELSSQGLEPAFVVNNAGFGLSGAATALSRDEQLAMIDVNVRALTELSLMFIDSVARHRTVSGSSTDRIPESGGAIAPCGGAHAGAFSRACSADRL